MASTRSRVTYLQCREHLAAGRQPQACMSKRQSHMHWTSLHACRPVWLTFWQLHTLSLRLSCHTCTAAVNLWAGACPVTCEDSTCRADIQHVYLTPECQCIPRRPRQGAGSSRRYRFGNCAGSATNPEEPSGHLLACSNLRQRPVPAHKYGLSMSDRRTDFARCGKLLYKLV